MIRIIFSLILLILACNTYSQIQENDTLVRGEIRIYQDARMDSLLTISLYINEADPYIDGFRIEIFFESGNNSHTLALEEKGRFVQNHADIPVYITFQAPNYKVRIGDFRTILAAERYLQEIIDEYPGAWVVADRINFPIIQKEDE